MSQQQPAKKNAPLKSASITLRNNGSKLVLLATARPDGSVVSTVTTTDAEKKSTRGMSETHRDMNAAKAHLSKLAQDAAKLGWQRGKFAAVSKPDAFKTLPAPPQPKA
jgi:hypothetical protein